MIEHIPATIPRVALVTGAARRIGQAVAVALADAGFAVAVHCHQSRLDAEATAVAVRARGVQSVVVQCDLADEAAVQLMLPMVAQALGPVGVLVNNASIFERDEVHDATKAGWDAHMAINLRAPFVLMQRFAAALPEPAEGVIVNLLDERVLSLTPHFVSYTLSKAGLWALTQSLALALAPRIRVCAIGPGPALPSARQTPEQFAAQNQALPLRHGTGPDEIASAVLGILALPSFTGQMIALDGGQHMQWAAPGVPVPFE